MFFILLDDWRNIAIALTDPDFGEQKAQSGENAWLHQSRTVRCCLNVDQKIWRDDETQVPGFVYSQLERTRLCMTE